MYPFRPQYFFDRAVPKFMKRIKVPDYKDRNVFGVPLTVNVQRTGQPLPQSIQQAMRYLRNHCLDQVRADVCRSHVIMGAQVHASSSSSAVKMLLSSWHFTLCFVFPTKVGLFRKSGVKSRIQALRQMNESTIDCVNYEGQSAYDVADMLKQYFRDLPEPLMTNKLSETFLQIYQCEYSLTLTWLAGGKVGSAKTCSSFDAILLDPHRDLLETGHQFLFCFFFAFLFAKQICVHLLSSAGKTPLSSFSNY